MLKPDSGGYDKAVICQVSFKLLFVVCLVLPWRVFCKENTAVREILFCTVQVSAFVLAGCDYEEKKDPVEDASPFPRAGALKLVYLASFCGASNGGFSHHQHAGGLVAVFQQDLVYCAALKGEIAAVNSSSGEWMESIKRCLFLCAQPLDRAFSSLDLIF